MCIRDRLTEYLHDLFLVDDAAVGDVEDMRQLWRFIADLIRLVAVAQVGRDGVCLLYTSLCAGQSIRKDY